MADLDIAEWKRLLTQATRASVIQHIKQAIANLESLSTTEEYKTSPKNTVCIPLTSFCWDQSKDYVTIIIPLEKNVDVVKLDGDSTSLDIKIEAEGKTYQLLFKKLFSAIVVSDSSWKIKKNSIHVKIKKANNTNWATLVSEQKEKKEKKNIPDANGDPQNMLMDLMKNLYNEGDDDMKRTISKAWTEAMEKKGQAPMDF